MAAAAGFPDPDPTRSEIRLLTLQPGEPNAPVHFHHEVISLDDSLRSYETLSYAWGAPGISSGDVVYINNLPMLVSASLYAAVQTLRRTDSVRHLWIDALCINQADSAEKTRQVAMMRRIYTHCERCCIWLGTLDDVAPADAEDALHSIAWMAGAREAPAFLGDGARRDACGRTIKKLMGLPWWGRIWTVQESILPPRATLHWGPFALDWDLMYRAADSFFGDDSLDLPDEFWTHGGIDDLTAAMRGLGFSSTEDCLQLLWRWRFRRATDPRDKVYGLMGVQENIALPSGVACDYDIDVRTLFARVTADLIREDGSLRPLVGRRGERSNINGLPSWAVDWSDEPADPADRVSDFWPHIFSWDSSEWCTDRGLRGVEDELQMLGDYVLCLQGVLVDKLALVERRSDGGSGADGSLVRLLSRANSFGNLVSSFFQKYPDGLPGDWMQALLGVIFGRFNPESLGPGEAGSWEAWYQDMVNGQALFVTEQGRFGLGPPNAEAGYEVWAVGGSQWPLLLKPRQGQGLETQDSAVPGRWMFCSECFVFGIMKGEAVEGREKEAVDIHLY